MKRVAASSLKTRSLRITLQACGSLPTVTPQYGQYELKVLSLNQVSIQIYPIIQVLKFVLSKTGAMPFLMVTKVEFIFLVMAEASSKETTSMVTPWQESRSGQIAALLSGTTRFMMANMEEYMW